MTSAGSSGGRRRATTTADTHPGAHQASVRRVLAGEGRRLREIRLRALADLPEAFGSTFERESRYPDDVWTDRAAAAERAEDDVTFVAEQEGRWIGLVTARLGVQEAGQASVFGLWVERAARGRGVGRRLMEIVVEWARDRGARSVSLWVVGSNRPAIAMYRAMGFRPTGDEAALPRDAAILEVRMILPIT